MGPEEAAASLRVSRLERPAVLDSRMRVLDAWFRPYLENYTVDASILVGPFAGSICNAICVVKFLRAYGGCLGIRSR